MFYVDSQRTVTRRESSLITTSRRTLDDRYDFMDTLSTGPGTSTGHLTSESATSLVGRPKGTVRKEIVTLLFESMLDSIVKSWTVLAVAKVEDSTSHIEKTPSELTFTGPGGKKRKYAGSKLFKHKSAKSRSRLEIEGTQSDPIQMVWWSAPDEKSVIHFKNGNVYEGNISGKCMHGEGRFQWTDGTVYLGEFNENEMQGKGIIYWKDDTWYEGEFIGNLRHGKGLYVDSRRHRSYTGGWHCGTKHGKGAIFYSESFKNSYDGDWVFNVRHGYGIREYCYFSGYEGEWDRYTREGKGLMIWPNHDLYKGEWKNGVMSGYGVYVWGDNYNNTMAVPSLQAYRGQWLKGSRSGFGVLNFGYGYGSHYQGQFKDNKKDGSGKFVTNDGLVFKDSKLFIDNNLRSLYHEKHEITDHGLLAKVEHLPEPYKYDMCGSTIGLRYHVEEAFKHIDKQEEARARIVREYIENNKSLETDMEIAAGEQKESCVSELISEDLIEFELFALQNAYKCYETELKAIYYKYATICNTEAIKFTPLMVRLYLWQFYTDCGIHEKGFTLVEIDKLINQNPNYDCKTLHGPFEKVCFWQFISGLITIARHLYAKKTLPSPRPDTILASGFRYFIDNDVLPNVGRCKGHLTQSFGQYVPLKKLYELYCEMGEPHTIRKFLCAIRCIPHLYFDQPQPKLVEAEDDKVPVGKNAFVFGDELAFIPEDRFPKEYNVFEKIKSLRLFNFGNLSSKTIINIFAKIFPQILHTNKIMNLDIELSFLEFFEAFMACTEESVRVKEEELHWREVLARSTPADLPPPSNKSIK